MPRSCVRSRASIASNKKSSRETPGASAVQFTTANQLANSNTQQWVELQLSSWWPQSQLYRLHSQSLKTPKQDQWWLVVMTMVNQGF